MADKISSAIQFLALLDGVKPYNGYWTAKCPGHDDRQNSLQISESNGYINIYCHAGCTKEHILAQLHLTPNDLHIGANGSKPTQGIQQIIATYNYTDENSNLLYQVVRYETNRGEKAFRQRHPDKNGRWIWNIKGVRKTLYRLPELIAGVTSGQTVYVVEGEKDVDNLNKHFGVVATTNSGGGGLGNEWGKEYALYFAGAKVVVIADKDTEKNRFVGQAHAKQICNILHGIAASVKYLELPDNQISVKDASDWINGGGTLAELQALVQVTSEFVPPVIDFLKAIADGSLTRDKIPGQQPRYDLRWPNVIGSQVIDLDWDEWYTWSLFKKAFYRATDIHLINMPGCENMTQKQWEKVSDQVQGSSNTDLQESNDISEILYVIAELMRNRIGELDDYKSVTEAVQAVDFGMFIHKDGYIYFKRKRLFELIRNDGRLKKQNIDTTDGHIVQSMKRIVGYKDGVSVRFGNGKKEVEWCAGLPDTFYYGSDDLNETPELPLNYGQDDAEDDLHAPDDF
jgi:hypothetical protein